MDKSQEEKRCYCARCFLPVEPDDRIEIERHNYHRICSMCCICRTIPASLKMFYGHVFCNDCFKMHVQTRFRGENPGMHSSSWWMQWGPGMKPQKETKEDAPENPLDGTPKRCICARCLLPVDENEKVTIGDQKFHSQCARCYFCHAVPTSNVKIYYGQVFCEDCFHRHVLSRNRDNPSEFFKSCFEHWQNNAQFAESMKEFMAGNKESAPFIFMMHGNQPPFCRCGTGPQEWFSSNEPKKSASPRTISIAEGSLDTYDLSYEHHTELFDKADIDSCANESANLENLNVSAAKKIEKLTKYIHERNRLEEMENYDKKWKFFEKASSIVSEDDLFHGWVDWQGHKGTDRSDCPKCLWQSGPIYVNSEYLKKQLACRED